LQSHRTKEFKQLLAGLGIVEELSLFVEEGLPENFTLASRNVPTVEEKELRVSQASSYSILYRSCVN